ncbi:TIGR02678 family protein [Bacillus sp. FJAT-47783]|uniref:TIGR02678 family protein n=1 Tax=Bacillus sp. FJAT-47783 TaxID=2922712 RepID=UPI001FAC2FC5|nr:TIGR02678 family protein [Bacillus sp. FJAT-47783]
MEKVGFDEKAKEALEILFEHFWILRDEHYEWYQMIREREHILRRYISDKFGYRLIVHRHFIKLEKIPVEPESWMGIQSFKTPMDYALFCCLLAFLENKSVDEQFLLSDLCEELQGMYPSHMTLDWTNYEHRKSLIRVMQVAKEFRIVKVVDGEILDFQMNNEEEVLYEVPIVSRYFMRSYPKDLFQFQTMSEILEQEWQSSQTEMRRHRIYRKLFLSPVTFRTSTDDPDFYYLRNYRNRIREDIEKHTDYQFELFKNAALLTLQEKRSRFLLFPDQKAVMDIVLQFANIVREQIDQYEVNELGAIRMTQVEFEQIIDECIAKYRHGWSKAYREASMKQLAKELLDVMNEWKMAYREAETNMMIITSLLGRTVGEYPQDFMRSEHV